MTVLLAVVLAGAAQFANADPVTFSTTGVFSASGTATATFGGLTTLTFNGTLNSLFTPGGASFGDILATSLSPSGDPGPPITGTFTLNIFQTIPNVGTNSLVGTLSGTLGFNSGIATLSFASPSVNIGGIVYTLNPVYTLALPSTGVGGNAGTGTTTLQGTVTGTAVPEPASMMLLGTGLLGAAGALRGRLRRR